MAVIRIPPKGRRETKPTHPRVASNLAALHAGYG